MQARFPQGPGGVCALGYSPTVRVLDSLGQTVTTLNNPGVVASSAIIDKDGSILITGRTLKSDAFGTNLARQFFLAKYAPDHRLNWVRWRVTPPLH